MDTFSYFHNNIYKYLQFCTVQKYPYPSHEWSTKKLARVGVLETKYLKKSVSLN